MSDPIFFAPLKVPLTDVRTGLMSREWYLFFQAMYLRVGGVQAFTPDDLQIIGEVSDATEDGNDIRTSVADFERAISSLDEPQIPTDLGELQMLVTYSVEDPVPIAAKPTAKVGQAVFNGTALTFMPSDAAPPIDLTATFAWTGLHTFSKIVTIGAPAAGNSLTVNGVAAGIPINLVTPAAGNYPLQFTDGVHIGGFFTSGTAGVEVQFGSISNHGVAIFTNNGAPAIQFSTAGDTKINGKSGFNATAPIAKPTVTGSRAANAALASVLTALASYGLITDSSTV